MTLRQTHQATCAKATFVLLVLVSGACLLAGGASTRAQSSNAWVKLGSLPAGVWDVASDGPTSITLYALGSDGIAHSTDAGTTWQPCNRDATTMRAVPPLAGQNTTTALFATTAAGLRRSNDGCRTWTDVPSQEIAPSSAHIRWLAPYPNNLTVLYAGMDGLGGLYRSVDAGNTWQAASQGLPAGAWLTSLVADPAQPASIVIGVRFPGDNHPPAFLYRSSDGGLTWHSSSAGLYVTPNVGGYVGGVAWSGGKILASTRDDGLYASTDRGITWQPSVTPGYTPGSSTRPPRLDSLFSTQDGTLVVGTAIGAFESLDGGQSWQNFGPASTQGHEMLLSLDSITGRVLLADHDAIWGYVMPQGAARLPTPTPSATVALTPTPPPPPILPTSTAVPPTATATATPVTPTPKPVLVSGPKPSDPAQPGDPATFTFFPETSHNLGHGFRDYWQANGGLGQFGYPITEEFVENGVTVQYFERARFEYRDGQVSLGLLGTELTQGQFFRPVQFFPSTDTNAYFGATGHSVEGPFLDFWRSHGAEGLLGYPLSESFKADGSEYQWFERARLEWHSDFPTGQQITLGNIGVEALQKKGWLP